MALRKSISTRWLIRTMRGLAFSAALLAAAIQSLLLFSVDFHEHLTQVEQTFE